MNPMSWVDLEGYAEPRPGRVHGPTNAQSRLRLFGGDERDVRVTLYRDHHAWCPYCQKVWLWLEEKRVPYRVEKVTMFCYGAKERWYLERVPSGMLPALELDGERIVESDVILGALEAAFGALGSVGLGDDLAWPLRRLERRLFRAWCEWLCRPSFGGEDDARRRGAFAAVAREVEAELGATPGPFFRDDLATVDVIFIPYVERMNASLFYYKGYSLRTEHPALDRWLDALEARPTYRGTQSDFHTHVHDLPPQMGGCYPDDTEVARRHRAKVDAGPWTGLPEASHDEPADARVEALTRVLAHRGPLVARGGDAFDEALRAALTTLVTREPCAPPPTTDGALRGLRDRISVPRDMSLYAARRLREALEATAALAGTAPGPPIPRRHRRDQDPAPFLP